MVNSDLLKVVLKRRNFYFTRKNSFYQIKKNLPIPCTLLCWRLILIPIILIQIRPRRSFRHFFSEKLIFFILLRNQKNEQKLSPFSLLARVRKKNGDVSRNFEIASGLVDYLKSGFISVTILKKYWNTVKTGY